MWTETEWFEKCISRSCQWLEGGSEVVIVEG
jgi:hypothetical protein